MSTPLPEASLGLSWRRLNPSQWAVIALTVTGVAAIVVQFALYGNFLLRWNYDTGVYFGATLHTWNGVFPYRDFIFVQPPGITLVLAPAAFLQFVVGSAAGLETARALTLVVVVANVSLVAYVLRRWGVVAQVTGGLLMAAWPQLVALDWPITMDPFLVLFCLLALEYLLRSWEEPDVEARRSWQAGVLIGVAALMKLWALFPFVAFVAVALVIRRRLVPRFVGGAALGFAVPALPFFLASPSAFISETVSTQLVRSSHGFGAGVVKRQIGGFGHWLLATAPGAGWSGVVWVLALLAASAVLAMRVGARERAAVAAVALGLVLCLYSLIQAGTSPLYYLYFSSSFGCVLVGIVVGLAYQRIVARLTWVPQAQTVISWFASFTVALVALLAFVDFRSQYSVDVGSKAHAATIETLGFFSQIPSGSCVVTDDPYLLIYAEREVSGRPGCPAQVDPFGVWLYHGPHDVLASGTADAASTRDAWIGYLSHADYFLDRVGLNYLMPWDTTFQSWLASHYSAVSTKDYIVIYRNDALVSGGG